MENGIGLLAAVLLVTLCIFALPLGLNRKEKVTLSVVAFLIGSVGQLTTILYSFWIALLFVLLLGAIVTYMMLTRFGFSISNGEEDAGDVAVARVNSFTPKSLKNHPLFVKPGANDEEENENTIEAENEPADQHPHEEASEELISEEIIEDPSDIAEEQREENEIPVSDEDELDSEQSNSKDSITPEEELATSRAQQDSVDIEAEEDDYKLDEVTQEEIDALLNSNEDQFDSVHQEEESNFEIDLDEELISAEIEEFGNEDEADIASTSNEQEKIEESLSPEEELAVARTLETEPESDQEEFSLDEDMSEGILFDQDDELEVLFDDEEALLEAQSPEEEHVIESDEILEDSDVVPTKEELDYKEEGLASIEEPEKNNDAKVKEQMLHLMVEQLENLEEQLPSDQYVLYVKQHFHPELSDLEYYSFVRLLIKHYMKQEAWQELSILIDQLLERFEPYPIIVEELSFIQSELCESVY
ncbi:hypothetical protein [Thalassobacillus hwangdonensis]|uniref:MFS transporter n=1 Tax=Thalassobacillus hwangdonensis TaxID=546108 RepID=A0ABW3L0P3_9BACI